MICAAAVVACALAMLAPLRPDTPPPLPIPAADLDKLSTMEDVVHASVLEDGTRAPANLRLPTLRTRAEVIKFTLENYPVHLRERPSTAMPFLWLMVDASGRVAEAVLIRPSVSPELDSLALKLAPVMRFDPARVEGRRVGVWIPYPVQIGSYQQLARARAEDARPRPDEPTFTPYTVAPKLQNRDEVRTALVRLYPEALRKAGVVGKTEMWVQVDTTGSVVQARVHIGSGHEQLDAAAKQVAEIMKFSPALNRTTPVEVWIRVPVLFNVE